MAIYFADSSYEDADVVILGIPLDRTSSFMPGSRFAPDIIRLAMDNIESYSPYQHQDVCDLLVHDAGNLQFTFETPEAPMQLIGSVTRQNLEKRKRQLAVGGEHTITPAIVSSVCSSYPDLCVVQFDAHSDLRSDYLGEEWCHATAIRRVLDFVPRECVFQLGIRSFASADEMETPNVFAHQVLSGIDEVRDRIGSRPVYVTVDLDVLDPSVLPDVQTPQPGGCLYRELVDAMARMRGLDVVSADMVEFCPRVGAPSAGASVAAEVLRELTLLVAAC